MINNLGLTFRVDDIIPQLKINIEQDNTIGDTKYHI